MTAEAILRLVNDPVLPFYPLDIALDVQNKLKGNIGGDGGGDNWQWNLFFQARSS